MLYECLCKCVSMSVSVSVHAFIGIFVLKFVLLVLRDVFVLICIWVRMSSFL